MSESASAGPAPAAGQQGPAAGQQRPARRASRPARGAAPSQSLEARLWELLQPVARLWGVVTAVVMSGAGAELAVLGYEAAPGLICGAALVLVLECMWVCALFVDLSRRGAYSLRLRCWDFARWACGRARAPLYACAATALLFADLTPLATAAGGMLLVQAALRAAVPFSPHVARAHKAGSALLSQHDAHDAHDAPDSGAYYGNAHDHRFEEMTLLSVQGPERSRSPTPTPTSVPTPTFKPTPTATPAQLVEI